jgi:ABC-2 type transport system permease protein
VIRLIRAEYLKLRTTQVWFWLLLAAVALSVIVVVAHLAPQDGIQNRSDIAEMFTGSASAYVVVFVLGALGVTTEFRYQTITPTVLVTPSRWAIVGAKMIFYLLTGIAYAAICVVVQLIVALPWLSAKHIDYSLSSDHIPRALISVFAVVALFGIVGIGVGALVRNQIVAVSVGVIFLLVINNLFVAIPGVKYIYPFTPVGALDAILTLTGDRIENGVTILPAAGGFVVLVLWAFIPAIIGAMFTLNRDIT